VSHSRLIVPMCLGQALFAACKLNVFDLLRGMAPQHATKVARQVDASVCGTRRLLDACVALGLLEKTERGDAA
jgi:DNA-binding IclR family transcriptional regulator